MECRAGSVLFCFGEHDPKIDETYRFSVFLLCVAPGSPPAMLIYWDGRLFYSDALVWAAAGSLASIVPCALALRAWPSLWPSEPVLQALDFVLSALALNGVLGAWLRWSLLPGWVADRPALYALRATSAIVGSASLVWLLVQMMPRHILAATALFSACVSYNSACWSAAVWLHLQDRGLAFLLPQPVRDVLLSTPPIELLIPDASLTQMVSRFWQLLGVLLIPRADRPAALERLAPDFRARLTQPGIQAELPAPLTDLVKPWSEGPSYLRVRPLRQALSPGEEPSAEHSRAAPAKPAPAARARLDAPEWLLFFVLRQHIMRALCGGARSTLRRYGVRAARMLAVAMVGLLLIRYRRTFRRVLPSKLLRLALMGAAFVVASHVRTMDVQKRPR